MNPEPTPEPHEPMNPMNPSPYIPIPQTIDRLCYRYPSALVDAVTAYEPGRRMVAVKNVTVNEDYFQGHFPGTPLLPAVLMIETLAQVATMLVVYREDGRPQGRAYLRGVDNAKFRRQVVPGDRLRVEVTLGARRTKLARAHGVAYIDDAIVAEAELVLGLLSDEGPEHQRGVRAEPSAIVHPKAEIGDGNEVFPFASIGLIPQDLKFRGEPTRLVIGHRNVIREFVTIHRGTE